MDVPGSDPVILLWAWWVSLALFCSFNFASFPVVTRYPQSPNHNQQASRHTRIPRIFSVFAVLSLIFPNFHTLHRKFRKDSSFLLVSSCVFQCSIVLLLVLTGPDDLCGSFFFFLNGNSFPSASTLSRTCEAW